MPDIAAKYKLRQLYGEKPSYSENERKEAMRQVISAIKPEQFAVMPITVLFMPEIMEELVKQINNVPHFIAFVQRHRQTGVTEYENTVTKLATNENIPPSAYLQKHNPKIFDFITSSYGQGYVSLRNMNKEFYKQTLGIEELKDKLAAFSENLEELNRTLESKEATPSEKSDASKKIPLVGDKIDILKDALKEKGGE